MIFKRAKKPSFWSQIKNFFWPAMGWKRSCIYIKHRAIRLNASNYSVAAGLAFGCSISFAPTLGFHIIQALLLCFIFRANYLASVLGTVFGNPWTFPVLFLMSYKMGWLLINVVGLDMPFPQMDMQFSWLDLKENPVGALKPYFIPLLIGGYTMMLVTFPIFYIFFYSMVSGARAARAKLIIDRNKEA